MSEQIDSAAVRGKNMKNVIEPCALKRLKCLDRREYIMYASLRDTRSRLRYFLNADNMEAESRIKKIMQKDAKVGRIAMAVPVIISRALEMFLKCLLTKTCLITESKLSTIVSVAHMKQCIESEKLFNFLKDLVEQVTSTASQRDKRGMSIWPIYRTKRHEMTVKTPAEVVEMGPRSSLDSLDNDLSSGESKLYICF